MSLKTHRSMVRPSAHNEEGPLGDDSEGTGKKKKGCFRKLLKFTAMLATIGAVGTSWKRKQGSDLDDGEWRELRPPAGGQPARRRHLRDDAPDNGRAAPRS